MRSIQWPPDLTTGRPARVDGADALRQVIALSLLGDASADPFGPSRGLTRPDPAWRDDRDLAGRVRDVFGRLASEKRAELIDVRVSRNNGRAAVQIDYRDLEQGDRRAMEVAVG